MEVVAKSVAQAAQVAGTKLAAAKAVVEPLAATAGSNALRAAEKLGSGALEHIKGHPIQAAAVAGGAVLMATPAGVALPVLNVVGFGSGGVAANSVAAVIQSGIGNVVGGSAFAACQSAAAGGAGAAAVNGVVAGTGAVVSVAAAGGRFVLSKFMR